MVTRQVPRPKLSDEEKKERKLIKIIKRELKDHGYYVNDNNIEHILNELYEEDGDYKEFDIDNIDEELIANAVYNEGDIGWLEHFEEDEEY